MDKCFQLSTLFTCLTFIAGIVMGFVIGFIFSKEKFGRDHG